MKKIFVLCLSLILLASVSENALASSSLEPHNHEIIVSENELETLAVEPHNHEITVSENELET